MAAVACARCGRPDAPALERAPLPGPLGSELGERVCADCWREWQRMEVMVINELRLNFMDPDAQSILDRQMRQFFLLDGPAAEHPGLPTTP
ncbi:MAG TPA: Fe(2+)-trafficking protein [Thermoanaerobaculia bacterium]|nr:Fe(2+)-trafficking protein [Thermoanaerobaculia bacterium]